MTLPKLAVAQSGFGGRGYKNPVTGSGRIVPSVTTILKNESKDALIQWAVDQTAGYAVANAEKLLTQSEEWGFKGLRWYYKKQAPLEGKGVDLNSYYNGVRDDAADSGTWIHEWIQADTVPELQYPSTDDVGKPQWEMVEAWEQWKAGKEIIPHFTEVTVWNEELGYAGTFDGIWQVDGKHYLMDIKSSRGLYMSTWMQIAALNACPEAFVPKDEDNYMSLRDWQKPVEGFAVLHIRPGDWDNRGNYMAPFCKWVEMPMPIDKYFEGFKGLLQFGKAKRELEALERKIKKNA